MKNLMDRSAIIKLKEEGYSNRKIAKMLKINRKTVNKYWNEYKSNLAKLNNTTDEKEIMKIQESITSAPKYNSANRVRSKITPEFLKALEKLLNEEQEKSRILGTNKQALTKKQIYENLKAQGFLASYASVAAEISKIKSKGQECFIKQDYDFGDRLE